MSPPDSGLDGGAVSVDFIGGVAGFGLVDFSTLSVTAFVENEEFVEEEEEDTSIVSFDGMLIVVGGTVITGGPLTWGKTFMGLDGGQGWGNAGFDAV